MTRPTIKIVDISTDEEIEREMNDAEFAQYKADQKASLLEAESMAAKEAARQSALEKLAALGLTEAEIQALAG